MRGRGDREEKGETESRRGKGKKMGGKRGEGIEVRGK